MIQGVSQGRGCRGADVVEEEGLSSTLGKEDVEDENIAIESQIMKPSTEQTEIPPTEPKNPNPTVIEESVLEGALEEVTIPTTEDEVQVIALPVPMQWSPAFVKTLLDSSLNYDRLRTRRPNLPLMSPLNYEKHPFIEGLQNVSEEAKSFFDERFTYKGDYVVNVKRQAYAMRDHY